MNKTDWTNYRPLEEGEQVIKGDEIYDDDKNGWVKATNLNTTAPNPNFIAHRIYRRKI